MPTRRTSLYAGLALITLGVIFLITYFLPAAWPILLVCLGAFFLFAAVFWRAAGLTISGMVNVTLGGILLYQTLSNHWSSWYFVWPLIFAAVGAGMLLTGVLEPSAAVWQSPRIQRAGWSWLILGLLTTVVFWAFRAQIHWPAILWGMGCLFLLEALLSGVAPLAIPGSILGGLGLLLSWQNQTGAWSSWAYTWALIPAFIGLGLFFAFLRSRTMRILSLSMLSWSLVLFVLFGVIFSGQGGLSRLWPAALILAGVMVLFQALVFRGPTGKHIS